MERLAVTDNVLNYGKIIFGNSVIEGFVNYWSFKDNVADITFTDGSKYKTSISNCLLKHKELEK